VVVIKNGNQSENGKRDLAEVAPDQAKTSGSLRAIFDSHILRARMERRPALSASRARAKDEECVRPSHLRTWKPENMSI